MTAAVRVLSAEYVCAFIWAHAGGQTKAALCALAGVAQSASEYPWYVLDETERKKLRSEIADLVVANVDRQLEERRRLAG